MGSADSAVIRNRYSPWHELAESDLILEWTIFPDGAGRVGEYDHETRTIRLDRRMLLRQARCVLCHELRHAEAGDVLTDCSRQNARQEAAADDAAARLLIDLEDLGDALRLFETTDPVALAVELNVAVDVVETRLRGLHPAEADRLRLRLAG